MPPHWVEALQRGSIVFGQLELAPGAKLSDAARVLGFEASTADRYTVTTPVLGFAAQPVELVFVKKKLHTVRCVDPAWKSTGTSWDDYDPAIDVANFHATEKRFLKTIGLAAKANEVGGLQTIWRFDGIELALIYEQRTPSVGIFLTPFRARKI